MEGASAGYARSSAASTGATRRSTSCARTSPTGCCSTGAPGAAVLPGTAEEVAACVRACAQAGVPWVARGAGSGLSGGALPIEDGVLIVPRG